VQSKNPSLIFTEEWPYLLFELIDDDGYTLTDYDLPLIGNDIQQKIDKAINHLKEKSWFTPKLEAYTNNIINKALQWKNEF